MTHCFNAQSSTYLPTYIGYRSQPISLCIEFGFFCCSWMTINYVLFFNPNLLSFTTNFHATSHALLLSSKYIWGSPNKWTQLGHNGPCIFSFTSWWKLWDVVCKVPKAYGPVVALPTPQTMLAIGSNWKLPHSISNCESCKLSFLALKWGG